MAVVAAMAATAAVEEETKYNYFNAVEEKRAALHLSKTKPNEMNEKYLIEAKNNIA